MNVLVARRAKSRNLTPLWMLLSLFALPPLAAWLFYFNPQWLPQGHTHQGRLIIPSRPVSSLPLRTPKGAVFDWRALQGSWTLTLVREGGCDAACISTLIEARQIRRAAGANRQRIERLLILLPDPGGRLALPDLQGLEGTRLALADSESREQLLALFPVDLATAEGPLFLIDPRLDLMMTHDTARLVGKQILQDLEKLLKVSQSWVKGAQYGHQ